MSWEKAKVTAEVSYAKLLPKEIVVHTNAIHKHYLDPKRDIQKGSIRVVKPTKDILAYLGCPVGSKWNAKTRTCSPRPMVVKSVVPRNPKYEAELAYLKLAHPEIKVRYSKRLGVEAREPEDDLPQVVEAMKEAEATE